MRLRDLSKTSKSGHTGRKPTNCVVMDPNGPKMLDCLLKRAIPGLFFYIFVFQYSWQQMFIAKCWQWLDSNRGPLELESTALPTDPQPLPLFFILLTFNLDKVVVLFYQSTLYLLKERNIIIMCIIT